MRSLFAVVLVGGVLSTSVARAEVDQTRSIVGRHAREARSSRIVAGVALSTIGIGIGALGYHTYATAHDSHDGTIEFTGLQRGIGVSMIALGGFVALTGPFALLIRTPQERLNDELEDGIARGDGEATALHVRGEIARRAAGGRRARSLVRNIGYTLAGTGAIAAIGGIAAGDRIETDTRAGLIGGGVGFAVIGAGCVIGSLFETEFEKYEQDLGAPRILGGGVVPVQGGAIAGLGGTF